MSGARGPDAIATVPVAGDVKTHRPRGFAAMQAAGRHETVIECARSGGQTAHARGVAHEWDSAEASAAGRKGGMASAAKRKARREAK